MQGLLVCFACSFFVCALLVVFVLLALLVLVVLLALIVLS